jgi:hypothetical protein
VNDLQSAVRSSDDLDEHLIESWWIRRKLYSIDISLNGTFSCRGLTDNSILSSRNRSVDKFGCSIGIEDILDTCGLFGSNSVLLMTNESFISINESSCVPNILQKINYFKLAQKMLYTANSPNEVTNKIFIDSNVSDPNVIPSNHHIKLGSFESFSYEMWHPKSSSMDTN